MNRLIGDIILLRYRISGSSLLAAMDQSSQVPHAEILSVQPSDVASVHSDDKEQNNGSYDSMDKEKWSNSLDASNPANDETHFRVDDRSGRIHPTVDVAEVIRRWTHALQRIHKQSLLLVCDSSFMLRNLAPFITLFEIEILIT